jgi:hypothetical protein
MQRPGDGNLVSEFCVQAGHSYQPHEPFQAPARFRSGGKTAASAAIADVNGDGRFDLSVASLCVKRCINHPEGTVGVLLNGLFVTTTTKVAASPNPSNVNQSVTFTTTITGKLTFDASTAKHEAMGR